MTAFKTTILADKLRLVVTGNVDFQTDRITLEHVGMPSSLTLAARTRPDTVEINLTPYLREDFLQYIARLATKTVLEETIDLDVTPEQLVDVA